MELSVKIRSVINGYIVESSYEDEDTCVYTDLQHVLNYLVETLYDSPYGKPASDYACEIVDRKEGEHAQVVVVTRHKALVKFLQAEVWLSESVPVIEHATEADVAGKWVYGVLPLHLASKAYAVTEVSLDIPKELRGVELTLDQVKQYYKGMKTYSVKELKDE